jgi:hypothetical protein
LQKTNFWKSLKIFEVKNSVIFSYRSVFRTKLKLGTTITSTQSGGSDT